MSSSGLCSHCPVNETPEQLTHQAHRQATPWGCAAQRMLPGISSIAHKYVWDEEQQNSHVLQAIQEK